jgi:hypothetical protein
MGRRRSRMKCPCCLAAAVFRMEPTEPGQRVSELCVSCGVSWPAEDEPAVGADVLRLPAQPLAPAVELGHRESA